ncbi:MAG: hypothetical protein QM744_16235 [Mesorhizobium sp.]
MRMDRNPTGEVYRLRLVFSLVAALIVAVVLPPGGSLMLRDPDTWWHIKVGLDILANGEMPTVDTYSYTFNGQPWIAKEWLAQILLAIAWRVGGWNGVVFSGVFCVALTAFCASWSLSRHLRPVIAAALSLVLVVLADPIFTARPHLFTLPLIVIWTSCLFEASGHKTEPPIWLLGVIWLWANLHATFTLGFVIAGFAGLEVLAQKRFSDPKLLYQWIVFGTLCVIVTLLNPYGVRAILATFSVAYGNEAVDLINEWGPFDASSDRFQEYAILAGFFGLLASGIRISWPRALFCIFTLHLYLTHGRFVYLFFLLVPLVCTAAVAARFPSLSINSWTKVSRDRTERFLLTNFAVVAPLLLALTLVIPFIILTFQTHEPGEQTSAKEALIFVAEHKISGHVLNSYNLGGTLIFHGIPTFIDGRTDQLFLGGFANSDNETLRQNGKPLLERQIEKYGIDWALLARNDPRVAFFKDIPGWRRVYANDYTVVFVREGNGQQDDTGRNRT